MANFKGHVAFRRISGTTAPAAQVLIPSGNVSLSSEWGSTASVFMGARCSDRRGGVSVTSAGTGQGANPTLTITFATPDRPWAHEPYVVVCSGGGTDQLTVPWSFVSSTTTTFILKWHGTPVATKDYTFVYLVEG